MNTDVRVLPDLEAAAEAAAERLSEVAAASIVARGRFALAVSGGTTPRALYGRLGAASLPWDRTEIFFGDERCVAPTDSESNYGMVRRTLLSRVPLPEAQIHRIEAERGAEAAADLYDRLLRERFPPGAPALDLALLGLGADGHTASIFPGVAAAPEGRCAVPAVAPPGARVRDRVTLTLTFLNRARGALFLVAGAEKSRASADVLGTGSRTRSALPAASVRPTERVSWFLDAGAGGGIEASRPTPAGS